MNRIQKFRRTIAVILLAALIILSVGCTGSSSEADPTDSRGGSGLSTAADSGRTSLSTDTDTPESALNTTSLSTSTMDPPVTETPSAEPQSTATPSTATSSTEAPITDPPVTETSNTEVPTTKTPTAETPATEPPATVTPTTEETTASIPATDSSAVPPTSASTPETTDPPVQTTPVPEVGPLTMTNTNLTALSESHNVIFFLVDRFDEDYAERAFQETPGVYDELTGFTWFQDNISLFGHTYPAVPWLLTNKTFSCAQTRRNYLNSAYNGDTPLKRLNDAGYTINVYSESVYAYANLNYLPKYFANVRQCSNPDLYTYSTDMKAVYTAITETDFTLNPGSMFSFIHLSGCHDISYDENFETPSEADAANFAVSVRASFKIIDRYIQEMKRLGIYDNATIVITGDHGSPISDTREVREPRMTALFVKPSGSEDRPLVRSAAQVSHEDLWATIFKSEGLDFAEYGTSVFDVPEGVDRVRHHRWQTYMIDSLDEYVYEICGWGYDFSSWKEVSHEHYDKFLMD